MQNLKKNQIAPIASTCHYQLFILWSFTLVTAFPVFIIFHQLFIPKILSCISATLFAFYRMNWVMPKLVKELLAFWRKMCMRKALKKIWEMAPHCVMWSVWREPDGICFKGVEFLACEVRKLMLILLFQS